MSKLPSQCHLSKEEFLLLYSQYQTSRLSLTQFCSKHNISHSSFYYWKHKWVTSASSRAVALAPISIIDHPEKSKSETVQSQFYNQDSAFYPKGSSEKTLSPIYVKLHNGTEIQLTESIDRDLLLTILAL